jgi:hypothetical protein
MAELTRREFLKVVGTGAMAAGLGVLPAGCALQEGREVPILGIFPLYWLAGTEWPEPRAGDDARAGRGEQPYP